MLQNSYLHELCAQISQIVFLADLTVSQLITTVMNKKFHKTHISTSFVHKCHKSRPFLNWPFYGLIQLFEKKCQQNSYLHELCATNIRNRVVSWFDRFTAYYHCKSKKFKKTHFSTSSVHNYHKSCF